MGGSYAYFSDQIVTNNTFTAGTLDLTMQPTTSLDLNQLKPGDKILKKFNLKNNQADYFGKHIKIQFLWDWAPAKNPVL